MASPGVVPAVSLPGGGKLPMIGFGTWRLRGRSARGAVLEALGAGYRHLDTATMYANEAEVGQALRDSGLPRADVFVTTKIRAGDIGRVRQVLQASLRSLGTDYLDLWLVHWPPSRGAERRRVWDDLLAVQAEGLVRDVGVSNFSLAQIDELVSASGRAPAVNQIDWGPTLYDPAVLAGHADRGIAVEGYSPLKNTDLRDPVLTAIAAEHGVTAAQVVLRWHLQHDITVIPKSARPDRMKSNLDLFGFTLSAGAMAAIDGLARR
jgi:diketogulonate reductase-like aldo/keto reductase